MALHLMLGPVDNYIFKAQPEEVVGGESTDRQRAVVCPPLCHYQERSHTTHPWTPTHPRLCVSALSCWHICS